MRCLDSEFCGLAEQLKTLGWLQGGVEFSDYKAFSKHFVMSSCIKTHVATHLHPFYGLCFPGNNVVMHELVEYYGHGFDVLSRFEAVSFIPCEKTIVSRDNLTDLLGIQACFLLSQGEVSISENVTNFFAIDFRVDKVFNTTNVHLQVVARQCRSQQLHVLFPDHVSIFFV